MGLGKIFGLGGLGLSGMLGGGLGGPLFGNGHGGMSPQMLSPILFGLLGGHGSDSRNPNIANFLGRLSGGY